MTSKSAGIDSTTEGNARITGSFGALIFVLLFVEGITVLRVNQLISMHVFVGVLLIPVVAVKVGSTSYRFFRYYTGREEYVRKGPPPIILRLLGPVVTLTTVALIATGIGAVLQRDTRWIVAAHKASFILWFVAMTVHVLGHALVTPALAAADVRSMFGRSPALPGRGVRFAVTGLALGVGVVLGLGSLGWAHHWQHLHGH